MKIYICFKFYGKEKSNCYVAVLAVSMPLGPKVIKDDEKISGSIILSILIEKVSIFKHVNIMETNKLIFIV